MKNKMLILNHSKKGEKDYYYLTLEFRYDSGKKYRQLVCFLSLEEYNELKQLKSLPIYE